MNFSECTVCVLLCSDSKTVSRLVQRNPKSSPLQQRPHDPLLPPWRHPHEPPLPPCPLPGQHPFTAAAPLRPTSLRPTGWLLSTPSRALCPHCPVLTQAFSEERPSQPPRSAPIAHTPAPCYPVTRGPFLIAFGTHSVLVIWVFHPPAEIRLMIAGVLADSKSPKSGPAPSTWWKLSIC